MAFLTGACSLPAEEEGFASRDPARRVRAASGDTALAEADRVARLIEMLDSQDPAARMVASTRLRRDTGQDFGYDATAPDSERREAIDRWIDWYRREYLSAGVDSADDPYNRRPQDAAPEPKPSP